MITGKHGKTASGLIAIKEKNNSQGLIDMGIRTTLNVGGVAILNSTCQCAKIKTGEFKNFIILGEDPLGTAVNKDEISTWFKGSEFNVVQDVFMTETAKAADLVLPASFHFETGGSFTNTQKYIQNFDKAIDSKSEMNNLEQLAALLNKFGVEQSADKDVIFEEISDLLGKVPEFKLSFCNTKEDNYNKYFNNTCDVMIKKVSEIIEF